MCVLKGDVWDGGDGGGSQRLQTLGAMSLIDP